MLGSSRVAAQLAASREGLGSMSEMDIEIDYVDKDGWIHRQIDG
jgi:hypothetical protein